MLKRLLLLLISILLALNAQAQGRSDLYEKGKVLLNGGDTLSGMVQLIKENELLVVRTIETTNTFSARQVASFFTTESGRVYSVFEYPLKTSYAIPCFFEVLAIGQCLSLLSRDVDVAINQNVSSAFGSAYYPQFGIRQDFYLLTEDGLVQQVPGKRKKFFELLKQKDGPIQKLIEDKNLRLTSVDDMRQVVEAYNNLETCKKENR